MKEIEVKILDTKEEDLKEKLIELGAKKIFDREIEAIFLDTDDFKLKKKSVLLRLRKEGNKVILTSKKKVPNKEVKIREEYETEVSDFDETKNVLKNLGYKEFLRSAKRRISYKIGEVKFEFDKYLGDYDHIPEFLEIEANNIETLYKYAELLGFKKEDCKPWSLKYLDKVYKK